MKWFFGSIILLLWTLAISFLASSGSEINLYFLFLFLIFLVGISILWHAAYFKNESERAKSLVVSHALIVLSFGGYAIGAGVRAVAGGSCESHVASSTGSSLITRTFDYLDS